MQVNVEKINGANAVASALISGELLKKKQEKIAKSFARDAKIDGFRAGKVPMAVVMKRFGDRIKQDSEQEMLQELLKNALDNLEKKPENIVGEPQVSKFDRKEDDIDVEVKISFRPEVAVEGYEECIPDYSTPRVTKKDISDRLEKLMAMVAPLEKIEDDRGIENGDFVVFDFEGFIDGEAFEGGKAEKYTLEIGSGQFIPGFEDGMLGLKAGEEKDVEVKFPAEYGAENLAGKDAVFKVKLHEIQTKKIPEEPTEEMVKQLLPGEENADAKMLEERIKDQIRSEKLSKLYNEELKPQFVDAVVEKISFDLPENIVEQEIDMQFRNDFRNFSEEEINGFKEDPATAEAKRETYRADAAKSVKLTFIVDELARINGINVSDQEVSQTIYYEALQQGQDPKQYLEMYQKQGILPAVKMAMIEDKLFGKLFDKDSKGK